MQSDDHVISKYDEDTSSICAVTQFVGDNIDLNIVSIHGNTPFHSMGLIKVTNPAPPAHEHTTAAVNRVKMKALVKAKILKAAEVQILPSTNRKQTEIDTITFLPLVELSLSVTQEQPLLSPGDTLWAAGWVIKGQNKEFQHSNWSGWMKTIHLDEAKQSTPVDFLPVIEVDPNDHRTIFITLKSASGLRTKSHHSELRYPHLAQGCGHHKTGQFTHYSKFGWVSPTGVLPRIHG